MSILRLSVLGFIGVASASLYSVPTIAAKWVEVFRNSVGDILYFDQTSVRRYRNNVTLWEKVVYSKPSAEGATYFLSRVRYDCEEETFTLLRHIEYGPNRTIVDNVYVDSSDEVAEPVVPDSSSESSLEAACKLK